MDTNTDSKGHEYREYYAGLPHDDLIWIAQLYFELKEATITVLESVNSETARKVMIEQLADVEARISAIAHVHVMLHQAEAIIALIVTERLN